MFKVSPYFVEKIWGSDRLKNYGYVLPKNKNIGEAWVVSGYPGNSSVITSGQYKGQLLEDLWTNKRAIFNYDKTKNFPILIKIIDANKNLSVQVHPNNAQAKKLEHDEHASGKDECWYIIDTLNHDLVYGTHATNSAQLRQLVDAKKWDLVMRNVEIAKDQFYNIPSGTIHAITAGSLVYELQQSCDITYRFYDYDRLENGKPRELHIEKSLAVSEFDNETTPKAQIITIDSNSEIRNLLEGPYFGLANLTSDSNKDLFSKDLGLQDNAFIALTLLVGKAEINGQEFISGESAILLKEDIKNLKISPNGNLIKLMIAWPN